MLRTSAAWNGARVVLRQTSPEANDIFDFIIELAVECAGNWSSLIEDYGIGSEDLDAFLDYAATFLSNLGNYYVCRHSGRHVSL